MIMREIYYFYAKFFAKNIFSKFNKLLFNLSLRGLGVFNYQDITISGEQKFLENYLSKLVSPVIFDIGAGKGEYTSYCIHVNRHARVYAFEPHPKTFKILKKVSLVKVSLLLTKLFLTQKGKCSFMITKIIKALRMPLYVKMLLKRCTEGTVFLVMLKL